MTDNYAAERSALESTYPHSIRRLCIFHVLQAFWRFSWDSNLAFQRTTGHIYLVYADGEDALNSL